MPLNRSWTLKDTMVMAVLGVAFGALYMAWVPVWGIMNVVLGPIGLDLVYGFWYIAPIIAAYIIRKPGVALVTEIFAGFIELLMGTPAGASVLLGAAVQGIGCELVFAATGYKKYSVLVLVLAGMGASATSFIDTYVRFGYSSFAPPLLLLMLVVRLISGAVLAGLAGKWIADGLAATGALRSFPLGRERAERTVGR